MALPFVCIIAGGISVVKTAGEATDFCLRREENPKWRTSQGRALGVLQTSAGETRKTLIYVNNRLEGNALETISAMFEEAEV